MIKTITITKQGEVCDKCGEELKPMMNVTWKDKRYCTRCFHEMEIEKVNEIIDSLEAKEHPYGGIVSANTKDMGECAECFACDTSDTHTEYLCDKHNHPEQDEVKIKVNELKTPTVSSENSRGVDEDIVSEDNKGECDHKTNYFMNAVNGCDVCSKKAQKAFSKDDPEQEDEWDELGKQLDGVYLHNKKEVEVIDYIQANFVSKEKIKREGKQVLRTLSLLKLDWKDSKITEDEKLAFGLARDRAWTIVEGFIAGLGD